MIVSPITHKEPMYSYIDSATAAYHMKLVSYKYIVGFFICTA